MSKRTVVSNTAFLSGSALLTRFIAYLYFLIIARHFTAEQLGIYAVLVTTYLIAELLSNLGLDKIVVRDLARLSAEKRPELFSTALLIKTASSVFVYGLTLALFSLIYREITTSYLFESALFLASSLPIAFSRSMESYFTALERMSIPAVSQLLERCVILIFALGIVWEHVDFRTFLMAAFFAGCVRMVFLGLMFKGHHVLSRWQGWSQTRSLISESERMLAIEVLAVIYFRVDVLMVSKLVDIGETGIYNVVYKIFDFFIALFAGFLMAVFPLMARGEAGKRFVPMLLVGACGLSFISLAVILLRLEVLALFGNEFLRGSSALAFLMIALPFVYVNSMLANLAIVEKKIDTLLWVAVALVSCNIGLNGLLIPPLRMEGAAITTLVCEMLNSLILIFVLKSSMRGAAPLVSPAASV
jgi:O-antigen/teichoic acid export membrane protein